MIHPTRLYIVLAKNSKLSSQRNRLVSQSSETFAVSQESDVLPRGGLLNSSHRNPSESFQHLPTNHSLLPFRFAKQNP
jgi:hypothetical protein